MPKPSDDTPPSFRPSPRLHPSPQHPLASEAPTNPRIKRSNRWTKIIALAASAFGSTFSIGCVAYAYDKLEKKAHDAGTEAAKLEVADLSKVVSEDHATLKVVVRQQAQQSEDLHEIQQDIRALYKASMTGRPQERLEKPAPEHNKDGGR
jgi:hypothetical protein